jgi:hypothetical protein
VTHYIPVLEALCADSVGMYADLTNMIFKKIKYMAVAQNI